MSARTIQWRDVSLRRREITVRAQKEKTRRERIIPISTRLLALPEMRKLDPAGQRWKPDAYVFGNEVGERVKSVQTAWKNACEAARITDFQLRDLRHEAASCFDEGGMPIIYVSNMLGHSDLSTTSRYVNVRGAASRSRCAGTKRPGLQSDGDDQTHPPTGDEQPVPPNPRIS